MNPKARKRRLPHRRWSTEGKRKRLYARRKKLDPEEPIPHAAFLPDQLIQAAIGYRAQTIRAAVFAVIRAGRHAVQRDAETNRLSISRRPQNQMQIAGMKAVNDPAAVAESSVAIWLSSRHRLSSAHSFSSAARALDRAAARPH